jgi:hypothetical protein
MTFKTRQVTEKILEAVSEGGSYLGSRSDVSP